MSNPGLIYKKMSDVMKDIGSVSKDQKNAAQGFKFRGIDQFVNALYPALTKHGVFMTPRVVSSTNERHKVVRSSGKESIDTTVNLLVEYDFYAEDGSKVTVGPVASEGLDSGDKATNKALSGALKYALIQTFSIPTTDMVDQDADSPELGSIVATKQESVVAAKLAVAAGEKSVSGTATTSGTVQGTPVSAVKPAPFSRRSRATVDTKAGSEDIL